MFKKLFSSLSLILFVFAVLSGCATTEKIPPGTPSISVEYRWDKSQTCFQASPEINLSKVPVGTKTLKFHLRDLNHSSYNHGGGMLAYTGSSLIQKGAIKDMEGPCPKIGGDHQYELSVIALSEDKKILAAGSRVENCCQK